MSKVFFMLFFAALVFAPQASMADTPMLGSDALTPSIKPIPTPELKVNPAPVAVAADSASTPAESLSFTGKLQGGIMSVGGENTGWLLHKYQDGAEIGTVEIDLGSFAGAARDGETVSVTGQMTTRKYVERGDVAVFVVSQLTEVKPEQ